MNKANLLVLLSAVAVFSSVSQACTAKIAVNTRSQLVSVVEDVVASWQHARTANTLEWASNDGAVHFCIEATAEQYSKDIQKTISAIAQVLPDSVYPDDSNPE